MREILESLIAEVAKLSVIVRGNSRDVESLEEKVNDFQKEMRETIQEMRAAIAVTQARQNVAIREAHQKAERAQETSQTAIIKAETVRSPSITDTGKLREDIKGVAHVVCRRMDAAFNEDELMELAADFKIEWENLLGETRRQKVSAFVDFFVRRDSLWVLTNWLTGIRPEISWPEVPRAKEDIRDTLKESK